jgi:hypothetical protein
METRKQMSRVATLAAVAAVCALASVVLPLSGCATQNVSDSAAPLFDASDIAPVNLSVSSVEGGGVELEIVSRGPQLAAGVMVFADGSTEEATLSGITQVWASVSTAQLVCVMVQVDKSGDYWYFDNSKSDYWYFDAAGNRMTAEQGAQWYAPEDHAY